MTGMSHHAWLTWAFLRHEILRYSGPDICDLEALQIIPGMFEKHCFRGSYKCIKASGSFNQPPL
jgi:hypothetical protein